MISIDHSPPKCALVAGRSTEVVKASFDGLEDRCGRTIDHAIVGGARAAFYVRDISKPVRSVGAQLQPGAAEILLGSRP